MYTIQALKAGEQGKEWYHRPMKGTLTAETRRPRKTWRPRTSTRPRVLCV